ncbi:hypothetical protein [Cypionkella sp. TWP1-2-1b2]|uniref:hypothetical protein n=1 Tax=Cypionkella sp. TWP1-2-1b2 TaxID=2804675 RepID=UPI003CF8C36B
MDNARLQIEIIRRHLVVRIVRSYIGQITDLYHFAAGTDHEIAAWYSYPLGLLSDRVPSTNENRLRFVRQGESDFQAFHHQL